MTASEIISRFNSKPFLKPSEPAATKQAHGLPNASKTQATYATAQTSRAAAQQLSSSTRTGNSGSSQFSPAAQQARNRAPTSPAKTTTSSTTPSPTNVASSSSPSFQPAPGAVPISRRRSNTIPAPIKPSRIIPVKTALQGETQFESLLKKKLETPELALSPEESISLLMGCIDWGAREACQAMGEELVMVIGNTGSGKSTFVNYLAGCSMQRVNAESIGITGLGKIVIVKPTSKGGKLDEIMAIGHTTKSMTFMPEIASVGQGLTYCDCPGFLDNRGVEINIANAVNAKRFITNAGSVKIIMLINYHTLVADRGKGLSDMIKISRDLFGSNEALVKFKDSILIGVTNIPLAPACDDVDDDETQTLEHLRGWIREANLPDKFEQQALNQLSERLFIYDPLDNPKLQYSGSWNRTELLRQIRNLKSIREPSRIFSTVLTETDELALLEICRSVKAKIDATFQKKTLSEEDFITIADHLNNLNKLMIIEHSRVTTLVADCRISITNHFKEMINELDREYSQATANLSAESEQVLLKFKRGLQNFDEQVQNDINISALQTRYNTYKNKQIAREAVKVIAEMERKFYSYCSTSDVAKAEKTYSKIKVQVNKFDEEYALIGIPHGQDVKHLKGVLARLREKETARAQSEEDKTRKIAKLQAKQDELLTAQRRQAEEEKRKAAREKIQVARDTREREASEISSGVTNGVAQLYANVFGNFRGYNGGFGGPSFDDQQRLLAMQQRRNLILQQQLVTFGGMIRRPERVPGGALVRTAIDEYRVLDIPRGFTLENTPEALILIPGRGPTRILFP